MGRTCIRSFERRSREADHAASTGAAIHQLSGLPDIVVVGGGLIGLATAFALQNSPGGRVVVVEAEASPAQHQSGRNSGVIHSGLYYEPSSLKQVTCVAGREALYEFCCEEDIPHRRTGKLVVATSDEALSRLKVLHRRGLANGLKGLRLLDATEMREFEPAVAGVGALRVEETGLVDFVAVAGALVRRIAERGGVLLVKHRVQKIRPDNAGVRIETTGGEIVGGFLVNCAGLHAHRVARMEGMAPPVKIVPFRGEYRELMVGRNDLVQGLVYPVPDPALPFLGVHLHRTLDGRLEAGPNAILATHPEGYRSRDISFSFLLELASYPGFWRMARRYAPQGVWELLRSMDRGRFLAEVQRLVPEIDDRHLGRIRSGVRAQAIDSRGRLVDDFLFLDGDRSVHVLNAPSPGATACLAIGARIASRVTSRLEQ